MLRPATLLLIVGTMAFAAAGAATAHDDDHHHSQSYGTNNRAWLGHGDNPWSRPNCFLWSPKVQYWVWICGPPYPTDMPHN
jgi:hypothetical protein